MKRSTLAWACVLPLCLSATLAAPVAARTLASCSTTAGPPAKGQQIDIRESTNAIPAACLATLLGQGDAQGESSTAPGVLRDTALAGFLRGGDTFARARSEWIDLLHSFKPASVPEPATALLAVVGAGWLALRRGRSRVKRTTLPAAALVAQLAFACGPAQAGAYAALFRSGWDAPDRSQFDGPRPGRAETSWADSGSFDNGDTFVWLASASAGDRRGDLHALLQSNHGYGFGYLATTSTVVGDVSFTGAAPRVVRFELDLRGDLDSLSGGSNLEAGGSLSFGTALSYVQLSAAGLYDSVSVGLRQGDVELISVDRHFLHARLRVEQLVLPGVVYPLAASLGASLTGYSADTAAADLDHTAQLSVWTPPDMVMISANGFLAEVPSAVPEPGVAWLLTVGVVALAVRRARPSAR